MPRVSEGGVVEGSPRGGPVRDYFPVSGPLPTLDLPPNEVATCHPFENRRLSYRILEPPLDFGRTGPVRTPTDTGPLGVRVLEHDSVSS